MTWQDIMNQVLEIIELQQELLSKSTDQVIGDICERDNKYCNKDFFDLKILNNGLLEHQITITPYQTIILAKINEMQVDTSSQSIYTNMPESIEEAEKYIKELKEKYELVIKCLDLVIDIEKISKTEYQSENNFENSEYARLTELEYSLFDYGIIKGSVNENFLERIIQTKRKEFFSSLSHEEKKNLAIQILTLSYDRNAFDYFTINNKILLKFNRFKRESIFTGYKKFKYIIKQADLLELIKKPLQQIYDEAKIIYETDFFKQKVNKK